MIKGEARFFSFTVEEDAGTRIGALDLPDEARAVCYYREERFHLAEDDHRLEKGDELVVLTHSRNLKDLRERWKPQAMEPQPPANADREEQESAEEPDE
jgi:trk system potassium uptake protein TrkA